MYCYVPAFPVSVAILTQPCPLCLHLWSLLSPTGQDSGSAQVSEIGQDSGSGHVGHIGESRNRTQDQDSGGGVRTGLRIRTLMGGQNRTQDQGTEGVSEQDSGSGLQSGSEQDSGSGPFEIQDQCNTGVQSRDQDQSRNQNFADTVGS